MKKILSALVAALLVLCTMVPAMAEGLTLKQGVVAAHGTKSFAVVSVVLDGDKIAAAYIDEFQMMDAATSVAVPNSEAMFPIEGKVLGSKRANSEAYSANMQKAGSTVAIDANYDAIQAFVVGKTVAELEAEIAGKEAAAVVDAVAGCTLADTLGYINGIIAVAK